MRAITINKAGPAESLVIKDLPIPKPSKSEIQIEQSYAGINYGDIIRRERGLFKLNDQGVFIPGFEGVGIISDLGSNITDFKIGDRVAYISPKNGGYSEFVCVHQDGVYKIPDSITDEIASVMTCIGATAWHLVQLATIKNNDYVLIHGASGGVGFILTQLCNLNGAKVIAIVGNENKKKELKKYNTYSVLNRASSDIINQIISKTHNEKIAFIFDCVGKDVLSLNLKCIREGGMILYYGSVSGHSEFPGLQILMSSLKLQGFNIFNQICNTQVWKQGINELIELVASEKLKIKIDKIFKLEEAPIAHNLLEVGGVFGKIALKIK